MEQDGASGGHAPCAHRGRTWTGTARHGAVWALVIGLLLAAPVLPARAQGETPDAPPPANEIVLPTVAEPFNPAIAAPIHTAPGNNIRTTPELHPPVGVPTLRWEPVAGATRYNVQVSLSAGFSNFVVNQNTYATAYTPKDVLADATYYWRVRAQVGTEWGESSGYWSFTKDWSAEGAILPVLLSPPHDPEGHHPLKALTPDIFRWEPVPGAAAYLLEISSSTSFSTDVYKATTINPSHTPTRHFANARYYWRVTPQDARKRDGKTSTIATFVLDGEETPSLLTPEHGVNTRFLPRFTWTAVPGAVQYLLEISNVENPSTDPGAVTQLKVTTANTSYTLEKALPNGKDWFWRVSAIDAQGVTGKPSSPHRFHADWVHPPILLSPPSRSIYHSYPYFSWAPVVGAERYQIQIASGNRFQDRGATVADVVLYNATSYTQPEWNKLVFGGDYYWRVRAGDAQGNWTSWTDERAAAFFQIVTSPPPNLVYPEPYYVPDVEGMPVHTDHTVAHPVFVWDTTHTWDGGNGPAVFTAPLYYSLTVASDREFQNVNFAITSAGNAAAPTRAHPFTNLVDGKVYYWRVTPVYAEQRPPVWTVWETRIDRTFPQLPSDTNTVPDISHPAPGFTAVGTGPVLGWLPVSGAAYYQVEVSQFRDFNAPDARVDVAEPLFAYYVPWQGRRDPMPPGVYWWRVRAMNSQGQSMGEWTPSRHFFIAQDLMTGNVIDYKVPEDGTLLSSGELYDPVLSLAALGGVTMTAPFDVGQVHIIQDRSQTIYNYNWIFAFGADASISSPVSYGIYLDMNQTEGMGGTFDPRGKSITVDSLYRPEYVIYLDRTGDNIMGASFYQWDGSKWVGFDLRGLGGNAFFEPGSRSIQLTFPYASIVPSEAQFKGALAATLFSSGPAHHDPVQEVVPAQGSVWAKPILLSDMLMPLYPFDTPDTNPVVFYEVPTVRWRMPYYDSIDGYEVEIATDANFSTIVGKRWESYESSKSSFYAPIPAAFHFGTSALNDKEDYYWRVRVRHERYDPDSASSSDAGPWSPPMRFKLTSYQVGNPRVSLTGTVQATPTFLWDRVEEAVGYTIEIYSDEGLDNLVLKKDIDGNSFTPNIALADGTYYWRVAMRRSKTVMGQWSRPLAFVKQSLAPTLISPVENETVNTQPTLIWTAVFTNVGELRYAAPRYCVQWDTDRNFSNVEKAGTYGVTEATAYTPPADRSIGDGHWYWRVAVVTAATNSTECKMSRARFSEVEIFYKEYLAPQVLVPGQGSVSDGTITLEWTPLDGAAYYEVEIADNPNYNKSNRVTTENARYTHTEKLTGEEYYWRVRMVDYDGVFGPFVPGYFDNTPNPVGKHRLYVPLMRTR